MSTETSILNHPNLHWSKHPVLQDKVAQLRHKDTPPFAFRKLITEIGVLLAYEATRDIPLKEVPVATPVADCVGQRLALRMGIAPVLRAGLGMVEGLLQLLPEAKVLHIGLYRNEKTLEPVRYYCKLPEMQCDRDMVIVLDPMLATGGTAIETIRLLKEWGVKRVGFMCIIACEYGVKKLIEAHPDVEIYAAAVDPTLNEKGYIVPGLGDAGDRQYN